MPKSKHHNNNKRRRLPSLIKSLLLKKRSISTLCWIRQSLITESVALCLAQIPSWAFSIVFVASVIKHFARHIRCLVTMTAVREAHLPSRLNGPSIMRSHPLRQKQRQSKFYLSFRRSEQQSRRRLNLPKVVRLIRKKIELKIKFKPVIKSPCKSVLKFTPIILRLFTPYLFLRSGLLQFLK